VACSTVNFTFTHKEEIKKGITEKYEQQNSENEESSKTK